MNNEITTYQETKITVLCNLVRKLVSVGDYESCIEPICSAMESNPHAPEPHNLMGIVLEKQGDHTTAMKHFRAAWALDPSYKPANHNLNTYGTFFSKGHCAFDESDLTPTENNNTKFITGENPVNRMIIKTQIMYDDYGIGHVVRR